MNIQNAGRPGDTTGAALDRAIDAASGVVAETMTALVLAQESTRKFGGDSLEEFVRNHAAYLASLR